MVNVLQSLLKDSNWFIKINFLILSYLQEWTDSRLDWSSNAAYSSIITMFSTGKYTWFPSLVLLNRLDFQITILTPSLSLSLSFLDSQSLSQTVTAHFPVYHNSFCQIISEYDQFFSFHVDLAKKMVVITRVVPKLLRQSTKLQICSLQFYHTARKNSYDKFSQAAQFASLPITFTFYFRKNTGQKTFF